MTFKREIYTGKGKPAEACVDNRLPVVLDLSDRCILRGSDSFDMSMLGGSDVEKVLQAVMGQVRGVCIGVNFCEHLLPLVDVDSAQALIDQVRQVGLQVWFTLPPMHDAARQIALALLNQLTGLDGVYANDEETVALLKSQLSCPVGTGAELRLADLPSVRDLNERGICGEATGTCAVRYPLALVCRGVCPLKSASDASGYCAGHFCIAEGHRELRTELRSLHRIIRSGDQLLYYVPLTDENYIPVMSDRCTILLKAGFVNV